MVFIVNDTTLLISHDNLQTLEIIANREFKKICEFFRKNKLCIHPDKTKFMIFSTNKLHGNIKICCNNNNENQNDPNLIFEIEEIKSSSKVPAIKFLGVYFDPLLNFKFHISTLKNKLAKTLYALKMSKNKLSNNSLYLLYFALFHSHLVYANIIWSCTDSSTINSIFKLQKKAIRLISGSKFNAHTEPLFKKTWNPSLTWPYFLF